MSHPTVGKEVHTPSDFAYMKYKQDRNIIQLQKYITVSYSVNCNTRIAKRASDVMTQTRLTDKQTGMADDFLKTPSKTAGVPKTLF